MHSRVLSSGRAANAVARRQAVPKQLLWQVLIRPPMLPNQGKRFLQLCPPAIAMVSKLLITRVDVICRSIIDGDTADVTFGN